MELIFPLSALDAAANALQTEQPAQSIGYASFPCQKLRQQLLLRVKRDKTQSPLPLQVLNFRT
jgi:hypothetical protein